MRTCPACFYPHDEPDCPNPVCDANPQVPDATKASWRADRAERRRRADERERIRRIRRTHSSSDGY